MTEGLHGHRDKPMCMRIWLEVGHACEPRRTASGRALALDWRLWVRGVGGHDISSFVHKVVFYLHPASAFFYPKRVLQEPPYEIQESGSVSIDIPIHVYLKHSVKPKKIRLRYSLAIESGARSSSESRCVYYDVENPSEPLWKALMVGGGEVMARTATAAARRTDRLVVLPDATRRHKCSQPLRKRASRNATKPYYLEDACVKCESPVELKKQLRSVAMTDDEARRVSQLCLSINGYERSQGTLVLPPQSDPIYRPPDLPKSLREALKKAEPKYAKQWL